MTNTLEDEVRRFVASMDNEHHNQEQNQPDTTEQEKEPEETIHIHYFPDAIVILKEGEETPQPDNVIDTTLAQTQKPPVFIAYAICSFYLFLIFSCIAFQVYEILKPPIATVTIIPKAQTVILTGTLQLGRVLNPIRLSQSQAVPTTGKGHQDARNATGYITFFNGQLNSVFVPAGLIVTGSDGVQIITDQDANIPAANLPQVGQTTVSAHAVSPGSNGNISEYDINQGCCATAIKAVNTNSFRGGQNERDFSTVSQQDIHKIATTLKSSLERSINGALAAQRAPSEALIHPLCSETILPNHNIGDEAIQVQVTVSETCSAVAYNSQELEQKATDLLTHQAATRLETGYSLFGVVQVTITQATIQKNVIVSFHAQGIWVYALSQKAQEQIKRMIAGKTKQQAMHILASLPGVERVSISWGDDTRLPKNSRYIHFVILIIAV